MDTLWKTSWTARSPAWLAALALAVVAAPSTAHADDGEKGTFGLGIVFGEPSGVNAKLYLSDTTAIDLTIGAAIIGGGVQIHGDHLWHPWVLEDRELFVLPVYLGGGARLFQHRRESDSDIHVGLRAVGGLLFDFKSLPIDVFVEVAGVLDTVFAAEDPDHQGLGLALNLGVGSRYYF